MAHSHLRFHISDRFKRNAHNDEERRTGERNNADTDREELCRYDVYDQRYARDYSEEECAHKHHFVQHLLDVLSRGLSGTDTGNRSALLHKVV